MKCPICGRRHTSQGALAHMLVGHGPLAGASIPKRRRTRARLARIHRRLEAMGLSEVQTHQVITIVAEELGTQGQSNLQASYTDHPSAGWSSSIRRQKEVRNMGCTHYWRRRREYAPLAFALVVADFCKLLSYLREVGVALADGYGEGEPKVTEEEVWFNGLEKCGHAAHGLGITWPAAKASGVSLPNGEASQAPVSGHWFAGALLGSRTCGGDCSYKTLYFPRVRQPAEKREREEDGFDFDFCKTAYKPYDLAVTAFLVIAKHHLGDEVRMSSDGDRDQWGDAIRLCETVLGYGTEFGFYEAEES